MEVAPVSGTQPPSLTHFDVVSSRGEVLESAARHVLTTVAAGVPSLVPAHTFPRPQATPRAASSRSLSARAQCVARRLLRRLRRPRARRIRLRRAARPWSDLQRNGARGKETLFSAHFSIRSAQPLLACFCVFRTFIPFILWRASESYSPCSTQASVRLGAIEAVARLDGPDASARGVRGPLSPSGRTLWMTCLWVRRTTPS